MKTLLYLALLSCPFAFVGCGGGGDEEDPDGETEADELGIAAECEVDDDCPEVLIAGMGGAGGKVQLKCLTQFDAGYCAIEDCESAEDCPEGATCVLHEDNRNYCFRECSAKTECNANRSPESEANCSANFDYADSADDHGHKACIPPSSGS
jgi:hypothetical protein